MAKNPQLDRPGAERFLGRSAAGLAALLLGVVALALLVGLVQARWQPLLAVDRQVAAWLNGVVTGNPLLVSVLGVVTDLGNAPACALVLSTTAVVLLVRREARLAGYVAVTGLGVGVLIPAVKALVGRLRPVVELPIAAESGHSFPSGHALGSVVTYGVLLLVFLPAVPRRARRPLIAVTVLLLVAIGFTRLALGVHYLSDVLAGWLLGLGWLAVTTTAFRAWRRDRGLPTPRRSRGLAPEAAHIVAPVPDSRRPILPHPWHRAAELLVVWVLLLGVLLAAGWLITDVLSGTVIQAVDIAVVQWLADRRTETLTTLSVVGDWVGDTAVVTALTLFSSVLALAATRQWRPPLFLAITMAGEATLVLATTPIIDRVRPAVPHFDPLPPTSSFPSGHLAAAICLYGALSVLVIARARSRWRWLVLVVAVTAVALVAFARLYRGAHYPSDLVGSALLALPWLLATWSILRPVGQRRRDADGAALRGHDRSDRLLRGRWVEVGSHRLFVLTGAPGHPDGPPVVLIPGLVISSR